MPLVSFTPQRFDPRCGYALSRDAGSASSVAAAQSIRNKMIVVGTNAQESMDVSVRIGSTYADELERDNYRCQNVRYGESCDQPATSVRLILASNVITGPRPKMTV